jgi:hypothetical protein
LALWSETAGVLAFESCRIMREGEINGERERERLERKLEMDSKKRKVEKRSKRGRE